MNANISQVIDDYWQCVDPVRVGGDARESQTPDRYVTVSDRDALILRVDVYAYPPDSFPFQDAIIWQGNLVIGFGSHVHVVTIESRAVRTYSLESYYGHLYPTPDYLLIASGERLFRMEPDGSLLWSTEQLAIDGVLVDDPSPPVIRGQAELDPPGGWKPFAVRAKDGTPVQQ